MGPSGMVAQTYHVGMTIDRHNVLHEDQMRVAAFPWKDLRDTIPFLRVDHMGNDCRKIKKTALHLLFFLQGPLLIQEVLGASSLGVICLFVVVATTYRDECPFPHVG